MRLWLCPLLAALASLGAATAVPGATLEARLVKDIDPIPRAQGSNPQGAVTAGGLAFFAADDGETGRELWRTDGTVGGTFQLADVCPGACSGNPTIVARTERSVFFQAFEQGFSTVDLWVSDGSTAGTVRLAQSLLLPDPGRRSLWIASQGLLYFVANDLVHGAELWRSDGTPAGTFQVTELRPGFAGSDPAELTDLAGRLFFRADDGVHGPALWTSDGTAAGTRLVRDPLPGIAAHAGPSMLRTVGRTLYFVAPTTRHRDGLWKSDGTAHGTFPLIDFASSPQAPTFRDATVLGGRLLFMASDRGNGAELWATDGTKGGAVPLTRLAPASPFLPLDAAGRLLPQTSLNGRMILRVDDGVHGAEPWVTDGTRRGTRLLRDLCPGPCSGVLALDPAGIAHLPAGGLLLFSGDDGDDTGDGFEPWVTDGTPAGTRRVADLCPGPCSSSPAAISAGPSGVFFLAQEEDNVSQLWRSDGTAAGTVRLTSFESATALLPTSRGVPLNGAFLFAADDGEHGLEMWASDGTPQGTGLFLDLNREDRGGSFPTAFHSAGGKGFFFADDGIHGFELWSSDGTEAGTKLAGELTPGDGPAAAPEVTQAVDSAGQLFFVARRVGELNAALWRSDGTADGTVRLTPPDLQVSALETVRALGGRVLFAATDAAHGEELWTSDGTPEGARLLADLEPGAAGSQPRSLTVFQGRLYFSAEVGDSGRELWKSDGTAEGTVLVKDIDPRPGQGSEPQLLTEHAGRLFFSAADEEHGQELWSTDGTAGGTTLAADLAPGPAGFVISHLVSAGSHLFFSGGTADLTQQGLWVSDGTAAGTRLLNSVLIQPDVRPIQAPAVLGDRIFFASIGDQVLWTSDGTEEGTEPLATANGMQICEPESYQLFADRLVFSAEGALYETDGTSLGTAKILDLSAPSEASFFEVVPAGSRLLFRKWDRFTGSELWALEAR
ncbi:MAG TPA: ELWxxDGT repeat protein [Thermoanaerobaculia bacterium]|jgi:ELWxxDGT repeat protein|nr:ELWxxDGT repeat protein [Thermoanaerobaculia bacterium]